MLTVACVLKTGGEYTEEHVRVLKHMVDKHLTIPHRFHCLTDDRIDGIECVPLLFGWPKWWSKLELFWNYRGRNPALYLDLDTVIRSNIDDLAVGHRFTVIQNFWKDRNPNGIGSAVMGWSCDLSYICDAFRRDADAFIRQFRVWPEAWGDQSFIQQFTPVQPEKFQSLFPGRIVGYKHDCLKGIPAGASIVCFGGRPRPWEVELWKSEQRELTSVHQQHN